MVALPTVWRGGLTRCMTQCYLQRSPCRTDRFSASEPKGTIAQLARAPNHKHASR